jgi:isoleucyl-tRNA synthetase
MTYPRAAADGFSADKPSPSPAFPAIEERILEFWKQDGTFQASIDNRAGASSTTAHRSPTACPTTVTC